MEIHNSKWEENYIMKNNFRLIFLGVLLSFIFYACTKNEDKIVNEKNTESIDIKSKQNSRGILGTCCYINGKTLTAQTLENLCAPNAQAIVNTGTTTNYQYVNNTGSANNIIWSISSNPLNSATIVSNGSTVTVTYLSNFISGTLSVNGSGGTAQACPSILNITKSSGNGGTGTNCECPNPVIVNYMSSSGTHPYWRFNVLNIQSGDTVLWTSINNVPFISSIYQAGSSPTIINPVGPIGNAFTIFCTVSRNCNGIIKKRQVYYRNEFGGGRATGSTGFVDIVGGSCNQYNTNPNDIE